MYFMLISLINTLFTAAFFQVLKRKCAHKLRIQRKLLAHMQQKQLAFGI